MLLAPIALTFALQTQTAAPEIEFKGLGAYEWRITTSSPRADKFFNQGICFLYGFNHDEASRSFEVAAKYDPNCAMAYWGIAAANGPDINSTSVSTPRAKAAADALKKASRMPASPVEHALIGAAMKRFSDPAGKRDAQDQAYADAMREVWKQFPQNADVGALFAEALMDLRPWDYWKPDGSPEPGTEEAIQAIADTLKLDPNHPQANHLAIHIFEASPHPERGDEAANRLRFMQPGLGHMVHMPSHIDVRTGRWKQAVEANERAIASDEAYRKLRPVIGSYRMYMGHNRHMLTFAAMMLGQSAKAIAAADAMVAAMPPEYVRQHASAVDLSMAMPIEARIRFGRWDEILKMPEFPSYLPYSRAFYHMGRAVAFAAKGDVADAKKEQAQFEKASGAALDSGSGNGNGSAIMEISQHLLAGEVLIAQKSWQAAIKELRLAVSAEDGLPYDEPPDWIIPTRHTLGVALLQAAQYKEAEKVYREDLRRLPENGWSLYGLAEALRLSGRAAEAAAVKQRFAKVWADADMSISSSCMCVPGGERR